MDYVVTPFTVIRDTREQHGWNFEGFRADARHNCVPLLVSIEDACLPTGELRIYFFTRIPSINLSSTD